MSMHGHAWMAWAHAFLLMVCYVTVPVLLITHLPPLTGMNIHYSMEMEKQSSYYGSLQTGKPHSKVSHKWLVQVLQDIQYLIFITSSKSTPCQVV